MTSTSCPRRASVLLSRWTKTASPPKAYGGKNVVIMQKRSGRISATAQLPEHGMSLRGGPIPGEARRPSKPLRSHGLPTGRIPQKRAEGIGEGVDIGRREGPHGGTEQGAGGTNIAGHDRRPACRGLECRKAEPLFQRGENQNLGPVVEVHQRRVRHEAREADRAF